MIQENLEVVIIFNKINKIYNIHEAWEYGEVKNIKLRKMLDKAGYQDVHLIKGKGYFYLIGTEDSEMSDILINADTDIYVNSFNQQSVEDWFNDIDGIITNILKNE